MREALYDSDRRVVDQRKTRRKLGTRPRFDLLDQESQHVFKQQHLVFAEPVGAGKKQIGNTPERFLGSLVRAAVNCTFEFGD